MRSQPEPYIVVTGANGNIGKHVVNHIRSKGARVLAVDRTIERPVRDQSRNINVEDLGQVFDVLHGADAVIHLAAIPHQRLVSAATIVQTNVMSTWNVLEAAHKLGTARVVIASSIQAISTATPRTRQFYKYLPIDEDLPLDAQDEYSLSKVLGENMADMFARHYNMSVVSLRFPWVASPELLATGPRKGDTADQISDVCYLTLADTSELCWLAATAPLEKGTHWPLFAAAADTYIDTPTLDFVRRRFPDAELRGDLSGFTSLVSSDRAEKVLGFRARDGFRATAR